MSLVKRHLKAHILQNELAKSPASQIAQMLELTAKSPVEVEEVMLQDSRPEPMGGWRKSLIAFCTTAHYQGLDKNPHWPQLFKREQSYAQAAELERLAFMTGRNHGKPNLAMAELMGRWLNHVEQLTKG